MNAKNVFDTLLTVLLTWAAVKSAIGTITTTRRTTAPTLARVGGRLNVPLEGLGSDIRTRRRRLRRRRVNYPDYGDIT